MLVSVSGLQPVLLTLAPAIGLPASIGSGLNMPIALVGYFYVVCLFLLSRVTDLFFTVEF